MVHVSLFCLQCITVTEKGSLIVIVINVIVSNIILDGGIVFVEVFVIIDVVLIIIVRTVIITSTLVHIQVENLHLFGAPLLGLAKSTFFLILIIIISSITVFAGVRFVHQPGANHAPRASVTQVNHSVDTLSTFLRISANTSMQTF